MTITMIGIVLLAAIIILFSEDFGQLIKKIMNIRGMKLLLPLLAASIVVIDFFDYIVMAVDRIIFAYQWLIDTIAGSLQWGWAGRPVIGLVLIMFITLLPSTIIWITRKYFLHKPPFEYHWQVMSMTWLIASLLYVV